MNRSLLATIITFLIFVALVLWASNLSHINYNTLIITVGGGIITLYLGLIKYWIDADAMFKTLFQSFNERFDKLNNDLNKVANGDSPVGKTPNEVIQDYLNLCSEEFYWYKKGRIPKIVWNSWLAGMNDYLKSDQIKSYFDSQKQYDKSYYGFLTNIFKN
jgi:hypothetical protein